MKLKVKLVGGGWVSRGVFTWTQEITVKSIVLNDGTIWELIDNSYEIELADEVKTQPDIEKRFNALDIFGQIPKKVTFEF